MINTYSHINDKNPNIYLGSLIQYLRGNYNTLSILSNCTVWLRSWKFSFDGDRPTEWDWELTTGINRREEHKAKYSREVRKD